MEMTTYDKNENINDYWKGDKLKVTTQHIIHYQQTLDTDYFEAHVYQPLIILMNYIFIKNVIPASSSIIDYGEQEGDFLGEAFEVFFESMLPKYNPTKSAFSYFHVCIQNVFWQRMKRNFYKKNDITKRHSLDQMEEEERESCLPFYETPEDENESTNKSEFYRRVLNEYLDDTNVYTGTTIRKYRETLRKIANGELHLPSHLHGVQEIRGWLEEQTQPTNSVDFSNAKCRTGRYLREYLDNKRKRLNTEITKEVDIPEDFNRVLKKVKVRNSDEIQNRKFVISKRNRKYRERMQLKNRELVERNNAV